MDVDYPAEAVASDTAGEAAAPNSTRVSVKCLVSNSAAGSIIGKGGATIAELQQSSNTRIQLSQATEHFPGTSDRMLLTTGGISDVLTAMHLMFAKLNADAAAQRATAEGSAASEEPLPLRMVVPAQACGGIIGKGGANVRHFIEDSGAGITLSSQDQQFPGVSERVITLVGRLEQQLRATALILTKMAEDVHYDPDAVPMHYALPVPTHAMGGGSGRGGLAHCYPMHMPQGGGRGGHMGGRQHASPVHLPVPGNRGQAEKILGVADEHVGAIVGRAGRALQELQQTASVRVTLSGRGEFLPGTTQRMLTISGHPHNIALAERMIEDKIAEVTRLALQRGVS